MATVEPIRPLGTLEEPAVKLYSLDAERAVLGILMHDNLAWDRVGDLLRDSDFWDPVNQAIYVAIGQLVNSMRIANYVTVPTKLSSKLDSEVGPSLKAVQEEGERQVASVRQVATIVREYAIRRKAVDMATTLTDRAQDIAGTPVGDLLGFIDAQTNIICSEFEQSHAPYHWPDDELVSMLDQIQDRSGRDLTFSEVGLQSGLPELDAILDGLEPCLAVIAARPSMGKSSLALNIATNAAINQGAPALMFNLESTQEGLMRRVVASRGRIAADRIRTGKLTDEEWPRLARVVEMMRSAPFMVNVDPRLSIELVVSVARQAAREVGQLGVVVLDYLQLLGGEATDITRRLKLLSTELQCPVIVLSQLNRELESRQDKRPRLGDLKDAGSLEADADVVMFLYRDEYYNHDSLDAGTAEIIVAKRRDGKTGTARVAFEGAYFLFT